MNQKLCRRVELTLTKEQLNSIWNYYLSLERDMSNTSQYIEPSGQEQVYSFEFAKILVLSCTEAESLFKILCYETEKRKVGNISEYKRIILSQYPRIVEAEVSVSRLNKNIKPFENWGEEKLNWWDAYQEVKHNREKSFSMATYINAVTALAAVYILIFYVSKISGIGLHSCKAEYIDSEYANQYLICSPEKYVP